MQIKISIIIAAMALALAANAQIETYADSVYIGSFELTDSVEFTTRGRLLMPVSQPVYGLRYDGDGTIGAFTIEPYGSNVNVVSLKKRFSARQWRRIRRRATFTEVGDYLVLPLNSVEQCR